MKLENKFTIIIPTLWKSTRLLGMLDHYLQSEFVGEIIIIDNSKGYFNHFSEVPHKITLIQPDDNIYVNPAWNLGIGISKFENICLLNDDITFDVKIFELFSKEDVLTNGIIGLSQSSYELSDNNDIAIDEWIRGNSYWGWGCMIFLKREMWIEIPNDIKIWYGDNFIQDINPNPKWVLRGLKVQTEMSTTSDLIEFDNVKKQDQIIFLKNLRSKI
jgi:hypothetical protein